MTIATYRRVYLGLIVAEGEFMTNKARSVAADRHGVGAVAAGILHPVL